MTPEERRAQRRVYNNSPAGKAAKARWLAKPGNAEKMRAYAAKWHAEHRGQSLRNARARAGIVGATGETRRGDCPICERPRVLCLDHDHATGRIRGWICRSCNAFLGKTDKEAESRAARALAYIKGPPH